MWSCLPGPAADADATTTPDAAASTASSCVGIIRRRGNELIHDSGERRRRRKSDTVHRHVKSHSKARRWRVRERYRQQNATVRRPPDETEGEVSVDQSEKSIAQLFIWISELGVGRSVRPWGACWGGEFGGCDYGHGDVYMGVVR